MTAQPPAAQKMDHSKITLAIETLCQKGCKEVSRIILVLERNEPLEDVGQLSEDERQAVLAELKAIMAVYDDGSSCGPI